MIKKLELLSKYAPSIKLKKLSVYQYIKQRESLVKKYKIKVIDDDEISLQNTKAYIVAIENKEKIDLIYSNITSNPYINNVLDFVSLNKVIELEIIENVPSMPHFEIPDLILIPIFDQKLNFDFIYDYQRTNLSWEKVMWKDEINHLKNPIDLYGHYFYHFTDFIYINHYESIYYYYLKETGRIYLFDESKREFIHDYCIFDKKSFTTSIDINTLIEVTEFIANKDEALFDYLVEHKLITEKTYKKVIK